MLLLLFALFSTAYSITNDECSRGDLDFLCRNSAACSLYISSAEAVLCASLQDPTSASEPPTPPIEGVETTESTASIFATGTEGERGVVTGVTGRFTKALSTVGTEGTEERGPTVIPTEEGYKIAPVIVTAPRNITVPPGGLARFLCLSKGAPTPQTTITKLDETIEPDLSAFRQTVADRESSISMIQEIENVVEANEGWYRCLSCNYYGCARADGYLNVLDLCKDVVCEDPKVCVADYETETSTCECPDYCDGNVTPDFVCSNYCGTFYSPCQMQNEACAAGRFDEEVMLKGYCPIDLVGPDQATIYGEGGDELSQAVVIGEGESLVLECRSNGKPEPEFAWYKSGITTPIASGALLSIQNAQLTNSGQYHCKATNCKNKHFDSDVVDIVVEATVTTPPVSTSPAVGPDDLTFQFPTSQCHVYGDPHFNTFDSVKYDFMGQCDYVLAMDCEAARWFVYGRMRACGRGGSCLESVTIYYNNQIVELMRGWLVNHFGAKVSPKNFPDTIITVGNTFNMRFDGRYLHVDFTLDQYTNSYGQPEVKVVKVIWDGYVSVEIHTPHTGRTCGLCGNNDGDMGNDFNTRRAGQTDSANAFGDSWKIDRYNRCPATLEKQTNEEACGADYESVKAECEAIFAFSKFVDCNNAHDNTAYIDACIYDQCIQSSKTTNAYPPKCSVASAYAARCEHLHYFRSNPQAIVTINVSGWEEATGCPKGKELFNTILDSGCPQLSEDEDEDTRALINAELNN